MGILQEFGNFLREFGFTTLIAVLAIYALYKIFQMREEDRRRFQIDLTRHAEAIERISHNSNNALGMNTLATKELTDQIKSKFDSEKIRRERKELVDEVAARFKCNAAEAEVLMMEQNRRSKLAEGGA